MDPTFTKEQIKQLSEEVLHSKTLEGEDFMPGLVGMNNLKQTDYVNVVLQIICTVEPLRDYFLLYKDDSEIRFDLNGIMTQHLSELVRKVWNPRNFKGHVNPHEVMQAITGASRKIFKIGTQKDPTLLLSWLLNNVNSYVSVKKKSLILTDLFRGYIEVSAEPLTAKDINTVKPSQSNKPFW
jgi:U4/U6.U5 tri-snRNP-associated protein 2